MSTAASGAARDLAAWRDALDHAVALAPAARELDVTGFDPADDLARRARWWRHRFESDHLAEVLAFGVALAQAEVAAWERGDPVVATKAFEDRRFLFSDRIIHWVVPLTYQSDRLAPLREALLGLGERLRPAALLTGDEGIHPPGEDSFGPMDRALRVALGPAERWDDLMASHPGTARLWRDLARRARRSKRSER